MSGHAWVHQSGSTDCCVLCGCTRYNQAGRNGRKIEYSQWKPRKRTWSNYTGARAPQPECEDGRSHTVPQWLADRIKVIAKEVDSQ